MPFFRLGKPKNAKRPTPIIEAAPVEPTTPTIVLSPLTAISLQVGTPFSRTFSESGGTAPYTYASPSGVLPEGFALVGAALSGTPTVAGPFSFGIQATDANGYVSSIYTFSGTVAAEDVEEAPTDLSGGTWSAEQVRIGAGGLMTSIEEASTSGRIIAGNDTGPGPWVLDPDSDTWRPAMRAGAGLDLADIGELTDLINMGGCPGVSISPDGTRAAVITAHHVWTTTTLANANPQWTKRIKVGWDGNGSLKGHQRKIQIDPANPDVIYVASQGNYTDANGILHIDIVASGLHRSLDGGATWSHIASVPVATGAKATILCLHKNGALSSGRTGTVAVMSEGNGVYISTNGGTSFALSSGSPTNGRAIEYTAGGKLLVNSTAGDTLYRLSGGAWSTIALNAWSMACHPTDATKCWGMFNGQVQPSTDEFATLGTQSGIPTRVATDIGWQAFTEDLNMGAGESYYSNRFSTIVFANGVGVWRFSDPSTSLVGTNYAYSFTEMSKGIENMVTHQVGIEPSSGDALFSMHDRIGMRFARASLTTAYPSTTLNIKPYALGSGTGSSWGTVIVHASPIHWALDDPNWQAVTANTRNYYTANKWASEPTRTAADSGAYVGDLVVRNKGEMWVVSPTNKRPRVTLNYGASWADCDFGATANTYMGNIPNYNSYFLNRRVFARDDTNGDLYFYCVGGPAATNEYTHCAGMWKLPNNGSTTWQRQGAAPWLFSEGETTDGTNPLTTNTAYGYDFYNGHLRAVPGKSGHLFWCPGDTGGPSHAWFSPDGGVTKLRVGPATHNLTTNPMLYVMDVAFGLTLPGRDYPVLFFVCSASRLYERAEIQGLSPKPRQQFFMIQDFDPETGSGTIEPIELDNGLLFANGQWSDCLGIAAWSDSADFVVTYGNCGALALRYQEA